VSLLSSSPILADSKKLAKKKSFKQPLKSIVKSPLKWAGGKRKLIIDIEKLIPASSSRSRLIEPFVGGGSVFLNMQFANYFLVDSNPDLIALFTHIKNNHTQFLKVAERLFSIENNQASQYYELRREFNATPHSLRRSVLFLYLNRHGYNGLCRYNSKGIYNVPFGRYKKPYFPSTEIAYFAQRAVDAALVAGDFSLAFDAALPSDIIYCDPPYTPINETSSFTAYSGQGFLYRDQQRLVKCALNAQQKGITSIVSNHDLPVTRELYSKADKIISLNVARSISCKGQVRKPCAELIAIYKGC